MNLRFTGAPLPYANGQVLQQHYRQYGTDNYAYYKVVGSTPERVFAQPLQYFDITPKGALRHPQFENLNRPTITPVTLQQAEARKEIDPLKQWLHNLVDTLDVRSLIQKPDQQ